MYQVTTYIKEDKHKILNFKAASSYVWIDHITYTRNAIISIPNKLGDVETIIARLMKNQEDIGDLIRPYYNSEDVTDLVTILKEHIRIAGNIALADPNDTTDWQALWKNNSKALINLMRTMNPYYWSPMITQPLWEAHMSAVNDQISSRSIMLYDEDVNAFDNNHKTIVDFANVFATGTIYCNLDKFSVPFNSQESEYEQF